MGPGRAALLGGVEGPSGQGAASCREMKAGQVGLAWLLDTASVLPVRNCNPLKMTSKLAYQPRRSNTHVIEKFPVLRDLFHI